MGGGGACRCGGAFGAVGWLVSLSREGCVVLGAVGASTRGGGLALVGTVGGFLTSGGSCGLSGWMLVVGGMWLVGGVFTMTGVVSLAVVVVVPGGGGGAGE